MVEASIFFIFGDDETSKDEKIALIKSRFLSKCPGVGDFNIEDIDGRKLQIKTLQEILKRLPIKANQRLIILRDTDYLNDSAVQYFIDFLKRDTKSLFLFVFCAGQIQEKPANKLILFLKDSQSVQKTYCGGRRRQRVFDLARNIIEACDTGSCLGILNQLLVTGSEPAQILGGLFWYWNNSLGSGARRNFSKDLGLFLETDVLIKTGKVGAELALEMLVVRLCQRQYS